MARGAIRGKWKALHFAARRFFAPLLLSAHVPGEEKTHIGNSVQSTIGEVHLHTVYDGLKKTSGVIRWSLVHLDGRVLETGEKRVALRPDEAKRQKTLDFTNAMKTHGARNIYLRIGLQTDDGQFSGGTVFLTAPRFMELPKDPISLEVAAVSGDTFDLTFTSPAFHHQVQFEIEGRPHKTLDNFFELYPNEPHTVRVVTRKPTTAAKLKRAVTLRSLSGSY